MLAVLQSSTVFVPSACSCTNRNVNVPGPGESSGHCADPDTVRAADAAFLSRDRAANSPPSGYLTLAPDLVVEVVSPNDGDGEIQAKVSDWLTAGSRLVWVIDPGRKRAVVYREDGSVDLLGHLDALRGEGVLPGFSCPLAEVW
jgi:Uma2 family endonuclease